MTLVNDNVWTSLVVLSNELIDAVRAEIPGINLEYIDWENANIDELPDTDLLGPTAVTISDYGQEQIEVTFTLAASSYGLDMNLFRHRKIIGIIFERLRPERQVDYYDASAALLQSKLIVTAGTLLAPMTKVNSRPWQYVQAASLLISS